MTFRVALFSPQLGKSIFRHLSIFHSNQVMYAWKIRTKFSQMAVERLVKWPDPRTCTFYQKNLSLQHTNWCFGRSQFPFLPSGRPCSEFCEFFPWWTAFTHWTVCVLCVWIAFWCVSMKGNGQRRIFSDQHRPNQSRKGPDTFSEIILQ